MTTAIRIENLGKCYRLGETHERTLSDQIVRLARRLTGREQIKLAAPEDFWALRDVNLQIQEGEAVGIIGGNGAGKSTLLKILSRITQPTTGRALVRGRLSSLLEVGTGFHPELTGRENVFLNGTILGMRHTEVARKFDEIVAFSGVEQFIDTPVKRYSSGMYVRLAFAVAAHLEPDVLVIDEVLAVGDAEFQKRCMGKMGEVAREGRTVIFVSHNMAAVQKLCSKTFWLENGQVAAMGDPGVVIGEYLSATSARINENQELPLGCLYRASNDAAEATAITEVWVLDKSSQPVKSVGTWDSVVFRLRFRVDRAYRSFSAVLQICTPEGTPLILTSTTPDQQLPFGVEPGNHEIDCFFERLPLAAGEFLVGAALAIPNVEYTWRREVLCSLHVVERDVYRSGLPPDSRRYLVASAHTWKPPQSAE